MIQADTTNNTRRRDFLALTAAVATTVMAARPALASLPDGSALLALEAEIFEQYELATAYDDEIIRLAEIWQAESERLYKEVLSREVLSGKYITPEERWDIVSAMPESVAHDQLCRLQEPFYARMDALVKSMFASPAHTSEGRRAKATVLLGCILDDEWRGIDAKTDYPELMVRNLLCEFVGGEPGAQLRDQFA